MPDAAGFDATQARFFEAIHQRTRAHVVLHALTTLDPNLDVSILSYREALDRLCAACMAELERLDAAAQASP